MKCNPSFFNNSNYIIMFAFVIDLFLNMRCTYFDDNKEITDDYKCMVHYVCSRYFLIDFITAIPYEIFINSEDDEEVSDE